MKLDRPIRELVPNTRMESASTPPKVVKHIAKSGSSEVPPPQKAGRPPKVRMGNGDMPVRIVKHMK
jgi:hypothetical protein